MVLEKFCKNCGRRILAKNRTCPYCGTITYTTKLNHEEFFIFPIHDVGFFNFDIDFSPYIDSKNPYFSYKICSCGHLISYESESCPNYGKRKSLNVLFVEQY